MSKKILIVDDSVLIVRILSDILIREGYCVEYATRGSEVLSVAHRFKPDILLLDIVMPDIDGFTVCKQLQNDFECKDIPVIMVTAKKDSEDIKRALELGAFDYIRKPLDEIEVVARVQSALRYKEKQEKLEEMAMKDSLTGVYNHALLIELLEKEYSKAIRKGTSLAYVMIDIDHFKKINDTYGHASGDIVLVELCKLLKETIRESDVIGRYGGEEFGIIFPEINYEDILTLGERLRVAVEKHPFDIGNEEINITISMGIRFKALDENITPSEMIIRADENLYKAKNSGRNKFII